MCRQVFDYNNDKMKKQIDKEWTLLNLKGWKKQIKEDKSIYFDPNVIIIFKNERLRQLVVAFQGLKLSSVYLSKVESDKELIDAVLTTAQQKGSIRSCNKTE